MVYVWATVLVVVNSFWLLLTAVTLPGNWLMVGCTVGLAIWQRGMFSTWTLIAITALAVIGEILEFITSSVGVRTVGGTRWGGVGAIIGALVGLAVGSVAIPVPILGSLVGACAGAFAGTMVFERFVGSTTRQAAKRGAAAAVGRLSGTLLKFAAGVLIWATVAVAAYWS
jgi:hypothetical protein